MSKPRNIMIVGSSGSGKSTLSKKLSQILGLRIINMDHTYW
jgi:adenylate kinase family enzyme